MTATPRWPPVTEAASHLPPAGRRPTRRAHLPDLAASLNNLSNQQADTGDRGRRAGHHHRSRRPSTAGWPQADPAAYLPDLAMSLNNLSVRQADTGDRDAALATITEAVDHLPPAGRRPTRPPTCPTWPCR